MKIKIISASLFLQFMTMGIGIQMAHGRMIFPMDTEYVLATLSWPKNMLAWLFRILSMTFQAVKIRGAMDPRAIFAENTWVWTFVTWLGITSWSVILRIFLKIHCKHQQSKRELIIQVVFMKISSWDWLKQKSGSMQEDQPDNVLNISSKLQLIDGEVLLYRKPRIPWVKILDLTTR